MAGVGHFHCSSYPSNRSVWFSLRTPSPSLSTTTTTLTNVSHARMPEAGHHSPHTCTPPFPSHPNRTLQLHFNTVLHNLFLFNSCTFLNTTRPFSVHIYTSFVPSTYLHNTSCLLKRTFTLKEQPYGSCLLCTIFTV